MPSYADSLAIVKKSIAYPGGRTQGRHNGTGNTVREEANLIADRVFKGEESMTQEQLAAIVELAIRKFAKIPYCYMGG